MENSNFRDQALEQSFSFSCYDFNSDNDDGESYIEIALEPTPTREGESEELELRISFSSMLPCPEFSGQSLARGLHRSKSLENLGTETETETETKTSSSSSSTSSCSGGDVPKTPGPADVSSPHKSMKSSIQFPAVNRLLNMLLSNLRVSSEMGEAKKRDNENGRLAIQAANWELVRSRKASKVTTAMNGGITKFLIKFRSIKFPSMLSFHKPYKVTSPQSNSKYTMRRSEGTQKQSSNIIKNSIGNNGEKSRVLEINLDAMKGVIEGMGMSIGRKDKQLKSCPSPLKSSPIHKGVLSESKIYTRETSVLAAIAHCKRSFGQTPDF